MKRSMLVLFYLLAVAVQALAQEATGTLTPWNPDQKTFSQPAVRRIGCVEEGWIQAAPTGYTARGGKATSLCNWGTTSCLYLENVGSTLNGTDGFMTIDLMRLSVLPAGVCRSLDSQVSSVGTRVETGAADVASAYSDVTSGPIEIKWWR